MYRPQEPSEFISREAGLVGCILDVIGMDEKITKRERKLMENLVRIELNEVVESEKKKCKP